MGKGVKIGTTIFGIAIICVLFTMPTMLRSQDYNNYTLQGSLPPAGSDFLEYRIDSGTAIASVDFYLSFGSGIVGDCLYVAIVPGDYDTKYFKDSLVAENITIFADGQLVITSASSYTAPHFTYNVPPNNTLTLKILAIGYNKNTGIFNIGTMTPDINIYYYVANPSYPTTSAIFYVLIIAFSTLLILGIVSIRRASQNKTGLISRKVNQNRLKTLEQLLRVSSRVKIDDVASVLEVPRAVLLRKLVELAGLFHFKIEEDILSFEAGVDVGNLVKELDAQFATWGKSNEKTG